MTLSRKIMLTTIGVVALPLLISSIINVMDFRNRYTDSLLKGSYGLAYSIEGVLSEMFALGLPLDSLAGMSTRLSELAQDNSHITYAAICDLEGVALFHSDSALIGRKFTDTVMKRSIKSLEPITQTYDRFDGNRYYDVTIPVFDVENRHVGLIRLGFATDIVDEKVWDAIVRLILNVIVTFSIMALLLHILLARLVTRPVASLADYAGDISRGDFSDSPTIRSNDELGALSSSLFSMATTIQSQMNRLQRSHDELEELVDVRTRELARAKDAAVSSDRYKSDFLARMSHEIRTPLNGIIGLTHLVVNTDVSKHQRDYLTKIDSSSQALLSIINDILDFSKVEAGQLTIEKVPFSMQKVLTNLANTIGVVAQQKNLEIVFVQEADVPDSLQGDPLRIGQILLNLSTNAVKFTKDGEVVLRVSLLEQKDGNARLQMTVSDTGIGIEQAYVKRLFEPFHQADGYITRKYGGTGLGLSICKQLVDLMGGEISLESVRGKGSTFTVTLPLQMGTQEASNRHSNFSGMSALVIDDNANAAAAMIEMLQSLGFAVEKAGSMPDAVETIKLKAESGAAAYSVCFVDDSLFNTDDNDVAGEFQRVVAPFEIERVVVTTSTHSASEEVPHSEVDDNTRVLDKPVLQGRLERMLLELFDMDVDPSVFASESVGTVFDEPTKYCDVPILLVEDNKINQQVACEFLRKFGATVDVAENGIDALSRVDKRDYALVLMDIQMPEMDGLTATRRIREDGRFTKLPIIAMTAHAMSDDYERSIEAGMNDLITKPISPDKLNRLLQQWIGDAAVNCAVAVV